MLRRDGAIRILHSTLLRCYPPILPALLSLLLLLYYHVSTQPTPVCLSLFLSLPFFCYSLHSNHISSSSSLYSSSLSLFAPPYAFLLTITITIPIPIITLNNTANTGTRYFHGFSLTTTPPLWTCTTPKYTEISVNQWVHWEVAGGLPSSKKDMHL